MTTPPFNSAMQAYLHSAFSKKGNKSKPKRIRGPNVVSRAASACHELDAIANLFRRFPIQHDVLSEAWKTTPTSTTLPRSDEPTPLEFTVRGSAEEFIHPLILFRFVFQILRENGDVLEEKMVAQADGKVVVEMDKVVPINFFHNTLWKQIDVKLNDTAITLTQQNTHPYLAYKRLLEEYSDLARLNMMEMALYAKEDSLDINAADPTALSATENFKWRAAKVKKSQLCEVSGPLFINGLVSESHLIPPNVDISVSLHRAPVAFALMSPESNTTKYKINITEAELLTLRIRPYPETATRFKRNMETYGSATLPLLQQETRTFTAPAGNMNVNQLVWDGRLPADADVILLDTAAFNGTAHRNPLAFGNHNLKSIGLEVNGRQIPAEPFKLDFAKNQYSQIYLNNLLSIYSAGRMLRNVTYPVSYEDFAQNQCIMSFRVTPNAVDRNCHSQAEHGTMRLKIDFPTTLTSALTVLVIGHMDRAVSISKDRSVRILPLEEV